MKSILHSVVLGFMTELYLAVVCLFGESHPQTQFGRYMKVYGEAVHAPAAYLYRSIFGEPSGTGPATGAVCFVFIFQWALYSAIAFGIFRLIRYVRRQAA